MTYRSMRRKDANGRAVSYYKNSKPAPCPFGCDEFNLTTRNSVDGHYVNCLECGATGPYAPSPIEARTKWAIRREGVK